MKKSGVSFQEKEANALNEQEIEFVLTRQGARVRKLKKRAERCVCKYCGEKLSLRKITYAAYDEAKIEVYCGSCESSMGQSLLFTKWQNIMPMKLNLTIIRNWTSR